MLIKTTIQMTTNEILHRIHVAFAEQTWRGEFQNEDDIDSYQVLDESGFWVDPDKKEKIMIGKLLFLRKELMGIPERDRYKTINLDVSYLKLIEDFRERL